MFLKKIIKDNYVKYKIPFPFIDIFIIEWFPKCKSKIHNHSSSGCLMFILKGTLYEEIYNSQLKLIKKNIYNSIKFSYINDSIGYHKILNKTESDCISIHFYHPKNHSTKYFD